MHRQVIDGFEVNKLLAAGRKPEYASNDSVNEEGNWSECPSNLTDEQWCGYMKNKEFQVRIRAEEISS